MDILIVSETFNSYAANTTCLWAIISEFTRKGHSCRVVTDQGCIIDSGKGSRCEYVDKEDFSSLSRYVRKLISLTSFFTWPKMVFDKHAERLYIRVKQQILEKKPDIVIAPCFSYNNLIVGSRLKKEMQQDIKYVAYFLDAIYCGQCPTMYTEWLHDFMALRAEKKTLSNADGIVMMNAAEKKYRQNQHKVPYFSKIKFLDIPLFTPILYNPQATGANPYPQNQINLFFAGSLPHNIRNPRYLLELFAILPSHNVHLYMAGNFYYKTMVDDFQDKSTNIHNLGLLNRNDVVRYSQYADILVNIGNSMSTMIPSKIFEYMSLNKPILTTIKIADDPCLDYYSKYGNCFIVDESMPIESSVEKLLCFINDVRGRSINYNDNSSLFIENRPSTFVNYIENI